MDNKNKYWKRKKWIIHQTFRDDTDVSVVIWEW